MTVNARLFRTVLFGAVAICAASAGFADEVKGRWRFDIQLGNISPGGRIDSHAGQVQTLLIPDSPEYQVFDPRPAAAYGTFANSRGDGRIELHASYGLKAFKNSELVIDFGVGYYKQTIRNIEWSYSFDSADPNYHQAGCESRIAAYDGVAPVSQLANCTWFSQYDQQNTYSGVPSEGSTTFFEQSDFSRNTGFTLFNIERVEGGEIKAVPISVDAMFRFRPTKRFNPYIGAGLGYLLVSFTESARFKEIADQMAGSLVTPIVGPTVTDNTISSLDTRGLAEGHFTGVDLNADGTIDEVRADQLGHAMIRPNIDAPSTWFFQARAGLEFQLSPHWSLFTDAKFFWANKNITITADGVKQFGEPTPNVSIPFSVGDQLNPQAFPNGGRGVYVIKGGLQQQGYDVIHGVPTDPFAWNGVSLGQPGEYYMNGGELKYGGWVFALGVKWTL